MFTVYAIKSNNRNYIYVGLTNNLSRRFEQHNGGKVASTKPYVPFRIIHTEKFLARADARIREKQLKSGFGKEYLKTLI